jgi:hypothetical protein
MPKQTPDDVIIEVFIGDEQQPGYLFLRASNLSRMPDWSNRF